ncbi:molybdopterin molybdotransferase MoeA [Halogeometricum sp. S1BR25-6]|uniref:Molybdopterin molybdotransferase MoeA n=1 Tax=Halogeometricum salsisoli TaxID=2950536 RepID=A0ABU2GAG8_9EURY|nr:molybdopterin molybdotransferase MoeA [Halogeometricum sp. S1BR25-6]MDS0297790.1 molybdopterin molybdotransferase MoeA [Halogeometricum sp. S1BR25-6]
MNAPGPLRRSVAADRLLELRAARPDAPTERVELVAAAGRTLAEPVAAGYDVPAYDRATMDGFALAADDDYPLTVVGRVFPEDDPPSIRAGEAVEIATGAPLPPEADAVLMREEATVEDGRLSGPSLSPGTHVYPAGATAAAGERLLSAGETVEPRHAALLRDVGVDRVTAYRPLNVGVLATGTEIREGRQPDRDSEMLVGLVGRWGHRAEILDAVPDEKAAVRRAIGEAAAGHDAVLTTGGTSVGHADHVVGVLAEHEMLFRGVALRPGRPVAAATVAGTPVFALPGKPMAAHAAATLVLRPYFAGRERLSTVEATSAARVTLPERDEGTEMEYAVPVTLDDEAGSTDPPTATPLGHAASSLSLYEERFAPGRVASSTRVALADGVVLTREALSAGEGVAVVPYEAVE